MAALKCLYLFNQIFTKTIRSMNPAGAFYGSGTADRDFILLIKESHQLYELHEPRAKAF